MTVEKGFTSIETYEIVPQAAIQSTGGVGRKLLAQLNTLDEVLANRGAPGATAQTFWGHDHALEGGAPIIRGYVWGTDGGDTAIYTHAPTMPTLPSTSVPAQKVDLGYMNASPGLNQDGRQLYHMEIRYRATAANFSLRFNNGEPVVLEAFDDAEPPRWATLYGSIPTNDWLSAANHLQVSVEQAADGMTLELFGLHVWETYDESQYLPGGLDVKSQPANYTIKSWANAKLAKELISEGDSVDALTLTHARMRLNALYEHTMDRPALGTSTQTQQGHDHHSSGYGGRPVPMGCIFSFWTNDLNAYWFGQQCTTMNQWYYFDEQDGNTYTTAGSSPSGTVTTHPMIIAPVSHGFSSSGNPPTTAPYLMAVMYVAFTTTTTVGLRIYNVTTGTHSPEATVTGDGTTRIFPVVLEKVPCSGGVRNGFALEVRRTSASALSVSLQGCAIFEVGQYAGTNRTYVSSTGTGPLAVASRIGRS